MRALRLVGTRRKSSIYFTTLPLPSPSPMNNLIHPSTSSRFFSSSTASTPDLPRPATAMSGNAAVADAVAQQKRVLRSKIRKDLRALLPAQRRREELAIQNFVLESPRFKSSTRLCAYISCEALREVDTSEVIAEILSSTANDSHASTKKKLYVPRVEDKNSRMCMLHISTVEDLVANSMNILEPSPLDANGNQREDAMLASDPVDIFLLPGLAFDTSGRRIGRGGGYYDVYIKKYQELAAERKWKHPLLVALAYSVQIIDENVIPVTPDDVSMDAIVSPSGVIQVNAAARERM